MGLPDGNVPNAEHRCHGTQHIIAPMQRAHTEYDPGLIGYVKSANIPLEDYSLVSH